MGAQDVYFEKSLVTLLKAGLRASLETSAFYNEANAYRLKKVIAALS